VREPVPKNDLVSPEQALGSRDKGDHRSEH